MGWRGRRLLEVGALGRGTNRCDWGWRENAARGCLSIRIPARINTTQVSRGRAREMRRLRSTSKLKSRVQRAAAYTRCHSTLHGVVFAILCPSRPLTLLARYGLAGFYLPSALACFLDPNRLPEGTFSK